MSDGKSGKIISLGKFKEKLRAGKEREIFEQRSELDQWFKETGEKGCWKFVFDFDYAHDVVCEKAELVSEVVFSEQLVQRMQMYLSVVLYMKYRGDLLEEFDEFIKMEEEYYRSEQGGPDGAKKD